MAAELRSRERVLLAVNHREADRLPMFRPNMIVCTEPLAPEVQDFLDTFQFDRFAGGGGIVGGPAEKRACLDGTLVDGFGCHFQPMGVGLPYCVHSPLADAKTVDDVESFDWPDPKTCGTLTPGIRDRAKAQHKAGQYCTAVGVGMLGHRCQYLRGFEQWFVDLVQAPDVFRSIMYHVHNINVTMVLRVLREVGDFTDIVTTGDDYGTSTAPYMSVDAFRCFVKPYYHDLISQIKSRWPHIKFYLHSHGQIMPYISDLIEAGVDILNPILPLDNMDPVVLKAEFGQKLCFEGGIDVEDILPFKGEEETRRHVRNVIDILSPGGGYWFKVQAISPVMPPANVIGAYDEALRYGRYKKTGQPHDSGLQ